MLPKKFKTPPFVVWRVTQNPCSSVDNDSYRLATNSVFGNILAHALVQCLVFSLFIIIPSGFFVHKTCWVLTTLVLFVGLAAAANAVILRLLNDREMQPIEALMLLSPESARRRYDESFPAIQRLHPFWPRWVHRLYLALEITWQTGYSRLPVPKDGLIDNWPTGRPIALWVRRQARRWTGWIFLPQHRSARVTDDEVHSRSTRL